MSAQQQTTQIEMVLFDFDDTIVRGKKGTQSLNRHLRPLSSNPTLRNAKVVADAFDPAAFVSFVEALQECGVFVGITSFGNGPAIRWYLEALFNPHSPTLENVVHPFQNTIVARGDPIHGSAIISAMKETGMSGRGFGKVVMARILHGNRVSPRNILVFDDSGRNVAALHENGYNVVQVNPETGLTDAIIMGTAERFTFGNCE